MKNKILKINHRQGRFTGYINILQHAYIYLLIISLISILGIIISTYSAKRNPINNESNTLLKSGWQYSIDDNNEFHDISLPASLSENITKRVVLKNKLPQINTDVATLLLRTSQQIIEVYIDHKLSYSCNGEINDRAVPTASYYFVTLPSDYAGKEIKIVIESTYKNYSKILNQIFIGSKTSHLFYIVNKMGFQFILGGFLFVIGILLLIAFMLLTKRHSRITIFIFIGGFFTCAGFWVMEESTLLQFFIDNPNLITNLGIFSLSLMPIFSGMYFYNICVVNFRKSLKISIIICCALSIFIAVISIVNPLLPLTILPYYTILLGIHLLIILTTVLMELKYGKQKLIPSIVGFIVFALLGLVSVISYLYDINTYSLNFFTLGLFLFCIMMMFDLIQYIAQMYKTSVKVSTLTNLAYTDSLTGLYNRSAFLKKLNSICLDETSHITIMVFDVNDLKTVNDTNGHLAGDALLKYCGDTLKTFFSTEDDIYRIGGDEFVAIIYHAKTIELEYLENRILDTLEEEGRKLARYRLSLAYGYATYNIEFDSDLFETFNRADINMYKCKKKQKNISKLV